MRDGASRRGPDRGRFAFDCRRGPSTEQLFELDGPQDDGGSGQDDEEIDQGERLDAQQALRWSPVEQADLHCRGAEHGSQQRLVAVALGRLGPSSMTQISPEFDVRV